MPTEKAPKAAKPRKAPAKKKTEEVVAVAAEPVVIRPSHEEIAALARKYWAERGYHDGSAEHDWLRAEQELLKTAS